MSVANLKREREIMQQQQQLMNSNVPLQSTQNQQDPYMSESTVRHIGKSPNTTAPPMPPSQNNHSSGDFSLPTTQYSQNSVHSITSTPFYRSIVNPPPPGVSPFQPGRSPECKNVCICKKYYKYKFTMETKFQKYKSEILFL